MNSKSLATSFALALFGWMTFACTTSQDLGSSLFGDAALQPDGQRSEEVLPGQADDRSCGTIGTECCERNACYGGSCIDRSCQETVLGDWTLREGTVVWNLTFLGSVAGGNFQSAMEVREVLSGGECTLRNETIGTWSSASGQLELRTTAGTSRRYDCIGTATPSQQNATPSSRTWSYRFERSARRETMVATVTDNGGVTFLRFKRN